MNWGDQSWQEMMIGWFDVAVDVHQKPGELIVKKKANPSDD